MVDVLSPYVVGTLYAYLRLSDVSHEMAAI
jgi:hypothetical protein